jgi:NAD(P)-dependent dehydrogenase (short-subunit alcohol dehydrogenase family)
MYLGLEGKAAIVTGAGRGIGRAIALALSREGVDVVVNDIDATVAENVAQEARSSGSRSLAIRADVTDANQVNEMVKSALDEFKRLDILVNNAGIAYTEEGPIKRLLFVDSTMKGWQREIDVILYGTLNCTKAVIDHMIKQKSGRIVNIASAAATFGAQRRTTYGAAKGGIVAFTMNLASEVGDYGITVNAIAPGNVEATRTAVMETKANTDPEAYRAWEERRKLTLSLTALNRFGLPEDIANAVVFFASDAASWITGQMLKVDGGKPIIRRKI